MTSAASNSAQGASKPGPGQKGQAQHKAESTAAQKQKATAESS